MTDLRGKHAVVTGGGSGVGATVALMLAQAGAFVTITGRQLEPLKAVAAQHESIEFQVCDVTQRAALDAALDQARARFGAVDIMVANAGAAISKPFGAMTETDMTAMFDVNVMGVFHSFQAVMGDMTAAKSGRMIAIASTAGLKGYGYVSGYVAAKHAVVGMVRALAVELAKTGVTVNSICPGFVETPMLERSIENIVQKTGKSREAAQAALWSSNPQARFIAPQEVGEAVLWLCSDGARGVNGHALSISGGEI